MNKKVSMPILFTTPTPPGEIPYAERSLLCFDGCRRNPKCKKVCMIAFEAMLEYKIKEKS